MASSTKDSEENESKDPTTALPSDPSTVLSPDTMLALVKCTKGTNNVVRDIYVNKNKFKIGRGVDCDAHILSPYISRNHCILNYKNDQWTITNLSSAGTNLNDKVLDLGVQENINVGDIVKFSDVDDFKFTVEMYVKDEPEKKKPRIDQSVLDEEIAKQKLFAEQQEKIRQELEDELMLKRREQDELKDKLEEMIKTQQAAIGASEEKNDMIKSLEDKIKAENDVILGLTNNYNQLLGTMEAQQREFHQRLNEEKEKWQQTLDMSRQEKEIFQKNMTDQMAKWREDQQLAWKRVLDETVARENIIRERLTEEKVQLEQRLKEANDALKQKTELAEKLQKEQAAIEAAKEALRKEAAKKGGVLTINLTKDQGAGSSSAEQGIFAGKIENIMDDQLSCQICSELFVTAVTLNCCHSFCQYCIQTWVMKKIECPICRRPITTITRSLVIDNVIEQMVNDLSPQLKERRQELVIQRKALTKPMKVITKQAKAVRHAR